MSDTVKVTIEETPYVIRVTDNTPIVTITDNTTDEVTVTQAVNTVLINADAQPSVTVNTGLGNSYDIENLLNWLKGSFGLSFLDSALTEDILHIRSLWENYSGGLLLSQLDGTQLLADAKEYTDTEILFLANTLQELDTSVNLKFAAIDVVTGNLNNTITSAISSLEQAIAANTALIPLNVDARFAGVRYDLGNLIDSNTTLITNNNLNINNRVASEVATLNLAISEVATHVDTLENSVGTRLINLKNYLKDLIDSNLAYITVVDGRITSAITDTTSYVDGLWEDAYTKISQTAFELRSEASLTYNDLNGKITTNTSSIIQTAFDIRHEVSVIEENLLGGISIWGSLISQNAFEISQHVFRMDGLDDKIASNESTISQTAEQIRLEVIAREKTDNDLITTNSSINILAGHLDLLVSTIHESGGVIDRIESAEFSITDSSAAITIMDQRLGTNEYELSNTQTMLSDKWSVTITEDGAGNKYSTGFGLTFYPTWFEGESFIVNDRRTYDGLVYKCQVSHTSSVSNSPAVSTTYWALDPEGIKSEFIVQADRFKIISPGSSPVLLQDYTQGYVDSQIALEETRADAYADGIVTVAEQSAIDAAEAYTDLKKIEANAYADGIVTAAEQNAIDTAQAYSDAQDNLHDIIVNAYADGIVTAEEERAIADATNKANAARNSAIAYTNANALAKSSAGSLAYRDAVRILDMDPLLIVDGKIKADYLQVSGIVITDLSGAGNLATQSRSDLNFTDGADQTYIAIGNGIISGGYIRNSDSTLDLNFGTGAVTVKWPGSVEFQSSTGTHRGEIVGRSWGLDINSPGDIELYATGGHVQLNGTYIQTLGTLNAHGSIEPGGIYYTVGNATKMWAAVHAYTYYERGGGYNDELDDLYELSLIKPRYKKVVDNKTKKEIKELDRHPQSGLMQLDNNSLPKWMNTYDQCAQKLKDDCGCMLTETDIEELLDDYEEAGWMISRNLALFTDLTSGAVRQLDADVIAMFELLATRISKLENNNKGLKL